MRTKEMHAIFKEEVERLWSFCPFNIDIEISAESGGYKGWDNIPTSFHLDVSDISVARLTCGDYIAKIGLSENNVKDIEASNSSTITIEAHIRFAFTDALMRLAAMWMKDYRQSREGD